MNIRTVAINQDTDLRTYLAEAEKSIDALSDEELDLLEKELEASIRNLMNAKPALRLVGAEPRKRKLPKPAYPAFSGLLIAALALFFMHNEQDESMNPLTTKGVFENAVSCSLLLQQPDIGSAELSDTGYRVKASAPVYLKTSCSKDLRLEARENDAWIVKEKLDSKDGYLTKNGKLIDLRYYQGKNLRIQSQEGVSEEFEIETDR